MQLEPRLLLAAFTPGDLLVYRVGDGVTSPTDNGTAVYLDEFSISGTSARLVQSIRVNPQNGIDLVASATGQYEGLIDAIVDSSGRVAFTGYDAAANNTTRLPGSAANIISRSVA